MAQQPVIVAAAVLLHVLYSSYSLSPVLNMMKNYPVFRKRRIVNHQLNCVQQVYNSSLQYNRILLVNNSLVLHIMKN